MDGWFSNWMLEWLVDIPVEVDACLSGQGTRSYVMALHATQCLPPCLDSDRSLGKYHRTLQTAVMTRRLDCTGRRWE